MNIVSELHSAFLEEAGRSPILLNDLANMEKYIAESYSGRSLIELLQNADDAQSNRFLIKKLADKTYIIANDGREFTPEDLNSLCRSGASTKKRKGATIGYRGIGFKSIVNYAKNVHLYSGQIRVSFSREETSKLLHGLENVPLIRIPHIFFGNSYINDIEDILNRGYTTVFVFETINPCLEEEMTLFDESCMLFLRCVREILFDKGTIEKNIFAIKRQSINYRYEKVIYIGTTENNEWIVCTSNEIDDIKIAFRSNNNIAINASEKEAVFHSFMPTNDKINIPLKLNGDFSTDPSRTKIVIDDETKKTIHDISLLFGDLISDIFRNMKDEMGLINIISQAKLDPLMAIKGKTISDFVIEELIKISRIKIQGIKTDDRQEIYFQPKYLLTQDFNNICVEREIYGISEQLEKNINGMTCFVRLIGIGELPLKDILIAMNKLVLSKETREGVLAEIIDRSRLGIDKEMLKLINNAYLITFESGIKKLSEYNKKDMMEEGFEGAVIERVGSFYNVESFYKVMGIQYRQQQSKKQINVAMSENYKDVGSSAVVKKWRSAEENVVEVLKNMEEVVNVIDVAAKNIGYDIEVVMKDGSSKYYEVKSVDSMGMAFSMTNNEFSSAVQYKDRYYLAIVHQDSKFMEICFISNPTNTLNMTKRVTRWEWYVSNYSGNIMKVNIV